MNHEIGGYAHGGPLSALGRRGLAGAAYLGRLKLLALAAARNGLWPPPGVESRREAVLRELSWMLGMGLPLCILIHVALGGFLAMQAYYGATFVLAAGPVVIIGLFRNIAPLLVGLILAGLLCSRVTGSLAKEEWGPSPGWVAFTRMAAAMIAGPVLTLAGSVAGIAFGAFVSRRYLGVQYSDFFEHGWGMIWLRDVLGIPGKGMLFGGIAALFASLEGLRLDTDEPTSARCYRACLGATFALLFLNTSWFLLVYKAGPAFGPTVLTPPIP